MKKIITLVATMAILGTSSAFAAENTAPDFLAKKGVIQAHYDNVTAYNLNSNITRREMLKVMMNLSGKEVPNTCNGTFADMGPSDWGCKYAEAALKAGYIAANKNYRPADNVSQIEALKMIMQAKGIERNMSDDWREGYVTKAKSEKLISGDLAYDKNALRSFIFNTAARTYSDAPDLGATSVGVNASNDEVYTGVKVPDDVMNEVDALIRSIMNETKNEM